MNARQKTTECRFIFSPGGDCYWLFVIVRNVVAENSAVPDALIKIVHFVHRSAHRLSDSREQSLPAVKVHIFGFHAFEMPDKGCARLYLIWPRPYIVLGIVDDHCAVNRVGIHSGI